MRKLLLTLLLAVLACSGPTEPDGPMFPAFYRSFGVPGQIESRITIANYDGETPWSYRIEADGGVLVERTVTVRQVEHTVSCQDIGSPHGLTEIRWWAEIEDESAEVSANLNC